MKFYPKALSFASEKKVIADKMAKMTCSIELMEGGFIKYYFPLEKQEEFNLTLCPKPQ